MVISRVARLNVGGIVVLLMAYLFCAVQPPVAASQALATCALPFHAHVYNGPHAGLLLSGTLQLAIDDSGSTTGILQTSDHSIGVIGQVTGRTLAVLLNLANGTHISAVGTADDDIRGCQFGVIFGPLVGPDLDDSGSWGPEPPCEPYPGCKPMSQ